MELLFEGYNNKNILFLNDIRIKEILNVIDYTRAYQYTLIKFIKTLPNYFRLIGHFILENLLIYRRPAEYTSIVQELIGQNSKNTKTKRDNNAGSTTKSPYDKIIVEDIFNFGYTNLSEEPILKNEMLFILKKNYFNYNHLEEYIKMKINKEKLDNISKLKYEFDLSKIKEISKDKLIEYKMYDYGDIKDLKKYFENNKKLSMFRDELILLKLDDKKNIDIVDIELLLKNKIFKQKYDHLTDIQKEGILFILEKFTSLGFSDDFYKHILIILNCGLGKTLIYAILSNILKQNNLISNINLT